GAAVAAPSLIGSLAGGYLVGPKATTRSLLLVPAAGFVGGALLAAWHFRLVEPALALPAVLAAVGIVFLYPGPLQEAIARQVSPRIRASAFSIEILLMHVLGDVWSPPLIGKTSDALQAGGRSAAEALATSLSWWVPVPLLIAAGALLLGVRMAKQTPPPSGPGHQ
ncbi:MAG: hypothetical protein AB1405_11935, partial [Bdellovibrionota bacterium]